MIYLLETIGANSRNFGSVPFTNNPTASVKTLGEEMKDRVGTHEVPLATVARSHRV